MEAFFNNGDARLSPRRFESDSGGGALTFKDTQTHRSQKLSRAVENAMCSQPQDHPLSLCFSTCQETESPRKREREKVKMLLPRPVLCTPPSLLGVGWGLGIGIRLILTSDLSQCLLLPWEQHSIFWIPYLDLTRVSPIPWVSWALLKNTDTILQLLDNH